MADSEEAELRKGPWTLEEDTLLIHYISSHGEGRWNLLARCSGLKRTGKSCRLRWLNYLKPDVKRGNLTPEEQLLILELHSKWGNRWSRIAQHLPGRTDNEIKNYWRTRVQKQARQLNIDANSTKFRDAIRLFWIPRLLQQMQSTQTAPRCSSSDINYVDASINSTPAADLTTLISCQAAVPESSQPSSPTKTQISNSNSTSTTTWGDETYCSSVSSDSKKMTQYSTTTFPEMIPDQEEFPTSPLNNVSEGSSVPMYNVDDPFQRSGGTTNYSYADADTCNYDLESLINNMQGYYDLECCGATDCSIAERCSSWGVHGTTENYLWDMDELRPIIGTSTTSTMS